MEREPPTVAIQATTELEAVLALVSLQEGGLGVHLHVDVCCYYFTCMCMSIHLCGLERDPFLCISAYAKNGIPF